MWKRNTISIFTLAREGGGQGVCTHREVDNPAAGEIIMRPDTR